MPRIDRTISSFASAMFDAPLAVSAKPLILLGIFAIRRHGASEKPGQRPGLFRYTIRESLFPGERRAPPGRDPSP